MSTAHDYLRGLWAAYLLDEDRYAFAGPEQALAADHERHDEFQVVIVRRSGLPELEPADDGPRLRCHKQAAAGDLIWVCEEELPLFDDDPNDSAAAWLHRAQAMAAGLNMVGGIEP